MGPSLYEVYPCEGYYGRPEWSSNGAGPNVVNHSGSCAPISSVTLDGKPCTAGSDCWLIHSDMLHEAPQCTGIAYERGAVTSGGLRSAPLNSGRVFWYLDGVHNELLRYDFSTGHGPGVLDHRTANIRRFIDVPVERSQNVPSHMVVDEESRSLFLVRPRDGSVVRVNIDSGRFLRTAQCVPDECYPSHEGYVEGTCENGYCDKGPCLSPDGHGCYHIFTETADIFEYELWTCSQQEVFASELGTPSGIAIGGGFVFVGDYASGNVHVFEMDGTRRQILDVSTAGLSGLDVTCGVGCTLHFVNMLTNELGRLRFDPSPRRPLTWSEQAPCNAPAASYSRPRFDVTHGPGYQNSMVIPHSYGKHCPGSNPGAPVDRSVALLCPDRIDCEDVNNDALLMSGYLCHPCLPSICDEGEVCVNLPYAGAECIDPNAVNE